jgi:hypothetical protein
MSRKKQSPYFKGALIGGIIGGVFFIFIWKCFELARSIMISSLSDPYPNVPEFIKALSLKIFVLVVPVGFGTGTVYRVSQFLILLIGCLLIGAFFGWLIGRTLSRKETQTHIKKHKI